MRMLLGVMAAVVLAGCGATPEGRLAGGCHPVAVGGYDICREAVPTVQAADAVLVPALFLEPGEQIVGEEHPALVLAGGGV